MCVCVYVWVGCLRVLWVGCMCGAWCVMRVLGGVLQLKLKMRCVKDEGYKINTITIYNV